MRANPARQRMAGTSFRRHAQRRLGPSLKCAHPAIDPPEPRSGRCHTVLRVDQDREPRAPVADEQVMDQVAAALRAEMGQALTRLNSQVALLRATVAPHPR